MVQCSVLLEEEANSSAINTIEYTGAAAAGRKCNAGQYETYPRRSGRYDHTKLL